MKWRDRLSTREQGLYFSAFIAVIILAINLFIRIHDKPPAVTASLLLEYEEREILSLIPLSAVLEEKNIFYQTAEAFYPEGSGKTKEFAEQIKKATTLRPDENAGILEILVSIQDRQMAARVANEICNVLVRNYEGIKREAIFKELQDVEKETEQIQSKLEGMQQKVTSAQLEMLQANSIEQQYMNNLALLRSRRAALRETYTEQHPEIKELSKQIERLETAGENIQFSNNPVHVAKGQYDNALSRLQTLKEQKVNLEYERKYLKSPIRILSQATSIYTPRPVYRFTLFLSVLALIIIVLAVIYHLRTT